jgi:hypothetical protein
MTEHKSDEKHEPKVHHKDEHRGVSHSTYSHSHKKKDESEIGKFGLIAIGIVSLLFLFNQYQISSVTSMLDTSSTGFSVRSGSSGISLFSGDGGVIVGPQLRSDGRTTKLVEWPTISDVPKPGDSGDAAQDAINYVIPTGTPWYLAEGPGADLGISFDDPIPAQQTWGKLERAIELDSEQQKRYDKLTSVFTCDYCCGGPNAVTTINRCGCAHAYAWKGMARFFVAYYGDKFSDEEILGEMTRWKGLWYPKGMIQDYLVYTGSADASTLNHGGSVGIQEQFAGQGGGSSSASISDLENLPGMVGGC